MAEERVGLPQLRGDVQAEYAAPQRAPCIESNVESPARATRIRFGARPCYHQTMAEQWKVCSVCRKPIGFGQIYYACNVSTCNRKRTALFFCSVDCWDAHLPDARHRDAWAEEKTAPLTP